MEIKPIPPPREFFFECPRDGTYRVSEETLRQFLTEKLRRRLDKRLEGGAHGAKLKFAEGCPTCEPNSTHEVTLIALRPRLN